MADVRSVNPQKYNEELAIALKKVEEFKEPEWVKFVKTSAHKERPTTDADFWYRRAASVLRQIYVKKILGVSRLRTRYGGNKNKGVKPSHFYKGGGKIIRTILQQAEKAGFLEKAAGKKAGRQLTQKGRQFMEDLIK